MLTIHQDRFQQYLNWKFQVYNLDLQKAEEPEIKLPTSTGSWKKQESSRKTSISALVTMSKPLTVFITTNCGKFFKRWEHQTIVRTSWEICRQVKKEQLELDMDWFQIGKRICQNCILSPCLFDLYAECIMWNPGLDEAQAGIKIAGGNVNNLRYADDITLLWQKVKRN